MIVGEKTPNLGFHQLLVGAAFSREKKSLYGHRG